MLRVGLTGGIACGKSAVAEMLAARGAHLAYADRIAHELMRPGEQVFARVVERFGRDILDPSGAIDRAALARVAFSDPKAIKDLNGMVHPAVIARQNAWMDEIGRRDPHAIAVVEAALIFEAGVGNRFDKMIVVTCSPQQKVSRLAQRLQISMEDARREVERRSAAQLPDEEKARRADYVIDNSGTLAATEEQVNTLFGQLRALADAPPVRR